MVDKKYPVCLLPKALEFLSSSLSLTLALSPHRSLSIFVPSLAPPNEMENIYNPTYDKQSLV